ncbi:hypothetical protein HOD75_01845 [archaeon]|jgi:hypothetical protein|nr:hypothetical protein [archaeon]MBT4241620.1 hypothetical protein [archaeon]MBT4418015.1 hypothetical protein [archaeon]
MENKKAQSGIEFLVLVGVVFFLFIGYLAFIQEGMSDKIDRNVDAKVKETALTVQNEINLAVESSEGYYREFIIPSDINGLIYSASINDSLIYVRTDDGRHAIALPVKNITGDVIIGGNVIRKEDGIVKLN